MTKQRVYNTTQYFGGHLPEQMRECQLPNGSHLRFLSFADVLKFAKPQLHNLIEKYKEH